MAGRAQHFRLTIEQGAAELRTDRRTLAKKIKSGGILPGDDGLYSLYDLVRAHFGDLQGEVLRKTREEADKLSIANQKERRQLTETPKVIQFCNGIGVVLRQKLLSSSMTDDEKDELLGEIRSLFDAGTVTEQICST